MSKTFREVGLRKEDRDFHRFLHRGPTGEIIDYRMTRVTFGITTSPYLASQVLHRIAEDYHLEYPAAAQIVKTSFYVDDILTGADTVEEAAQLRSDLNLLLAKGKMTLHKWRTNDSKLLNTIPKDLREVSGLDLTVASIGHCRTLGIHWDTGQDEFSISIPDLSRSSTASKRTISSVVARVFDVMGWFSPAILPAKLLLQEAWCLQVDWDDLLPDYLQRNWESWLQEVPVIGQYPVPHCVSPPSAVICSQTLHGYCDAFCKAYGGVVYILTVLQDTTIQIHLLTSKSKLAPLKKQTIPRLKLYGAQLLSKLLKQVASDLNLTMEFVYAWTDSSVVLGWLKTSSARLKVYVSHRVVNILDKVPVQHWRYVNTAHNLADLISRGTTPKELSDNTLWWSGPPWLSLPPDQWPKHPDIDRETVLPELKPAILLVHPPPGEYGLQFSSFPKLCRVTEWVLRFLLQLKTRNKASLPAYLTAEEIHVAETVLMRVSQQYTYSTVLSSLQQKGHLASKHSCSSLAPFIDLQGLIRDGERLQKADLPADTTHPILLSCSSHIARLIMRDAHVKVMHAGPSTVLARLSAKYHIPGAKRFLKGVSKTCVRCQAVYSHTSQQLMGELPAVRIRPARPFNSTGIDFAGLFTIKEGSVRKPTKHKSYMRMCLCLSLHKGCFSRLSNRHD